MQASWSVGSKGQQRSDGYIAEQRVLLQHETAGLAAQERDRALAILDTAIEPVMPHIQGDIEVETSVEKLGQGDVPRIMIITVEWEADQ